MRKLNLILMIVLVGFVGCSLFERNPEKRPRIHREDSNNLPMNDNSSPKKRVMVLPFLDGNTNRAQEFRDKGKVAFLNDLNRTGYLLAVDSQDLSLASEKYLEKGEFNFSEIAKNNQNLGVAAILEGKIIDVRVQRSADTVGIMRKMMTTFEAVVRVRMAYAKTGKEFFNTTKTVTLEQEGMRLGERKETDRFLKENPQFLVTIVKDAFLDFTPQIKAAMDRLTWEGRIAAINGDRIYLNVGRQSGVQIGDILRVTDNSEDIFDPQSGSHLGQVPGRQKGTLEVVSYFGVDGSVAVVHSGSGFKESDKVEIY